MTNIQAVAVIGIACRYPGAQTPLQFWENIMSRRRQFRRFPDCRMSPADYYHPDKKAADKTYGIRGAFIDGYTFDWVKRRIPKTTFQSTDIAHWLALDVALEAVKDASFSKDSIPGKRTGVLVGNSLTGEQTRANTMRLRWPYVRKALWAAARDRRLDDGAIAEIETALESYYKSAFPPITEDSLAGGLSNTIAGRICNALDLDGGGYTVDGACSSSLLAVTTAARGLVNYDMDLALAGGIDISLDPFELVGFAKTGALTPEDMTVYDRGGCGFIPGEGAGFVVLKRLEDAKRDKNYIYAILQGWGISSDGGGTGITAPTSAGQAKALRRAYDLAPYDMDSLHFIEGHGTGTTVGDKVELQGIVQAMHQCKNKKKRSCGVTSLKSIIGHTKAAAGIGGFIKTVIAVNRRVIPPTAACREPHAMFDTDAISLFPVQHGEILDHETTVRAGISAMGFGGINCHTTISSGDSPSTKLTSPTPEKALLTSYQETEVFVFDATSFTELRQKCQNLAIETELISIAEMADLACHLWSQLTGSSIRVSITASEPSELTIALEHLGKLSEDKYPTTGKTYHDPVHKTWVSLEAHKPTIAMLFSGQGAQQLNMAHILVSRFKWAADILLETDKICAQQGTPSISALIYQHPERAANQDELALWQKKLSQTEHAQPAICLTSLLWLEFLSQLGIEPDLVAGHSLGELSAFYAAGIFNRQELLKFAAIRGQAMRATADNCGSMVSLRCNRQEAEQIIDSVDGYLVLANINSPNQMILSGDNDAINQAINNAVSKEIKSYKLPVSNAFHSKMAENAAKQIKQLEFIAKDIIKPKIPVFSSTSGQQVPQKTKLNEHFAKQVLSQVDFISTVENMASQSNIFIEVGPGRILSGLTNAITEENGIKCLPVESEAGSSRDLNYMVAELFARGVTINGDAMYKGRLIRPYIPPADKIFIENQCEYSFAEVPKQISAGGSGDFDNLLAALTQMSHEQLASYLHDRGPFLAKVIQADHKYSISPIQHGGHIQPIAIEDTADIHPPQGLLIPEAINPAEILKTLIQEHTGFPAEAISPSSRLLDDLNLDSIKAGDILATFALKCGIAGMIEPDELTNASIEQILTAANSRLSQNPPAKDAAAILLEQIEKLTGFPKDSLTHDMRLLDDLNLDSIKAGDLLAQTAQILEVNLPADAVDLTNSKISELIDTFTKASGHIKGTQPQQQPKILDVLLQQTSKVSGFPLKSLTPESFFGKDLHFSQEMLQTLILRMSAELEVETHVDIKPLLDRTLSQVAEILQRIVSANASGTSKTDKEPTWVRDFTVNLHLEPLPPLPEWWGKREEDAWHKLNWLILSDNRKDEFAIALQNKLRQAGAQSTISTFTDAAKKKSLKNTAYSHITAILPAVPSKRSANANLPHIIKRLQSITSPAPASQAPRRRTTITYIQFGGGFFGTKGKYAQIDQCGARALAASLHLERRDLRVRVIDFSSTIDNKIFAQKVLAEINTPQPFSAVGYDYQLNRRIFLAKVSNSADYPLRQIKWTTEDTILVTGGARGITALCALRVAKETKVKMALVGSSPIPGEKEHKQSSTEIKAILDQYEALGLKAQYFSCDITQKSDVKKLFGEIKQTLGQVSGVIHGAGRNVPRLASQLTFEDINQEISPKVKGAINILEQCQKFPPKLIIGLTSIIGVTGMPGNAWYGFSNEMLDLLLRKFSFTHPQTQTQAIAFSIWRDEGMGARMGSVESLLQKGIDAIPTEEGISRFAKLFNNKPAEQQIVVSARLGGLDTWQFAKKEIKGCRYLQTAERSTPGVESVFTAHLDLATDPYLADHHFNGSYLMPTVFGLEAMAQAVIHVIGKKLPDEITIKDISLTKPITVSPKEGTDITITASIIEQTAVKGMIRIKTSVAKGIKQHKRICFSAVFELDNTFTMSQVEMPELVAALPIQPRVDLYRRTLLFQGELFQRINKIFSIKDEKNGNSALFETFRLPTLQAAKLAFPEEEEPVLVLGDPFFRDSLLQAAALLIPQDTSLPVGIKHLQMQTTAFENKQIINAQINLESFTDGTIRTRVNSTDQNGKTVELLADYDLKVLAHHDEYPVVSDLLSPDTRDSKYLQKWLQNISHQTNLLLPHATITYQPGIHDLPRSQRHKLELQQLKQTAQKAVNSGSNDLTDLKISWNESGKPEIDRSEYDISLSHDERLCLCVAGSGTQGCDTAPITSRSREQWLALLGSHANILDELIVKGQDIDTAGTRIWAAIEALKKMGGLEKSLHGFEEIDQQCTVFSSDTIKVVTGSLYFTWGPERIIAITAQTNITTQEQRPASKAPTNYNDLLNIHHIEILEEGGPSGQLAFVQRFPVTFRPSAMLNRTVYFSKFIDWIGEVRETSVWPILQQLSAKFASGEWGQVTNYTTLQIYGEATTGDMIEVRVWASDLSGPTKSTIDLTFDFRKVNQGQQTERIATVIQQTSWVQIIGSGIVRPEPFSDFYNDFIQKMLPQDNIAKKDKLYSTLKELKDKANTEKPIKKNTPPLSEHILHEEYFSTGLDCANLVGNIYFANYFTWQGRVRDRFLHSIAPDCFQGTGEQGELLCLNSSVNHLREAMPFDNIVVTMSLESVSTSGALLYFEYFREEADKSRSKLAYGKQQAAWVKKDSAGELRLVSFPDSILQKLS